MCRWHTSVIRFGQVLRGRAIIATVSRRRHRRIASVHGWIGPRGTTGGRWTWLLVLGVACVPEGPPTGLEERATAPTARTPTAAALKARPDPLLDAPYQDDFGRQSAGADWRLLGPTWRIESGALCARGARNRGAWLRRRLPTNARIEFDARSDSPDGDIKAELWGDGRSGAKGVSYDDATSYLTIFGGWRNRWHVLARLDEHGEDRLAVALAERAEDPRKRRVEPGQRYRFKVERRDGRTLSWWVDGVLIHRLEDDAPLAGRGHDHFGFNDWSVHVCFDNLSITPL